jgi:hypothetical protein
MENPVLRDFKVISIKQYNMKYNLIYILIHFNVDWRLNYREGNMEAESQETFAMVKK